MNISLITYSDLILSANIGNNKGKPIMSKWLFLFSVMKAIECGALVDNKIYFNNIFLREQFGRLYKQLYHNDKGYRLSFFLRPYYHLGSSSFYHLKWKYDDLPPMKSHTPSGKYLKENLDYTKLDDELWKLLQKAENREYFRKNITKRFLIK